MPIWPYMFSDPLFNGIGTKGARYQSCTILSDLFEECVLWKHLMCGVTTAKPTKVWKSCPTHLGVVIWIHMLNWWQSSPRSPICLLTSWLTGLTPEWVSLSPWTCDQRVCSSGRPGVGIQLDYPEQWIHSWLCEIPWYTFILNVTATYFLRMWTRDQWALHMSQHEYISLYFQAVPISL